jgi:nucleosome assembly protein 1-like 1
MSDTTGEAAQKQEEVIEIDSADGRGFVPMDQITQKVGEIGIEQQQEEEEEEDPLADLPKKVLIRLEALKKLQENQADLETEFEKERKLLELKYEKLYQPLYQERAQIVAGTKEVEGISSLTPEEAQENVKGIPGFWVRALMNHSIVEQIITERENNVSQPNLSLKVFFCSF